MAPDSRRATDLAGQPSLLDEGFLRKLDLLEIVFKRNILGRRVGDRPGLQRGGRAEFADFREYSPGDELRYLDWNVYARTDRLFIKEFTKDEAALVCLVLDASASMGFGSPPKFHQARRLAAAMGYLAVAGGNEARFAAAVDGRLRWSSPQAGRRDLTAMAAFLEPLRPAGPTDLAGALAEVRERLVRRSLIVLISDLLDPGEPRRGLRLLGSQRYDLTILHVLSPEELRPPALGPARLSDCESGRGEGLVVDEAALRLYGEALNDFCEGWLRFCQHHDIRYVQTSSAVPFEECVLETLRRGGLVR